MPVILLVIFALLAPTLSLATPSISGVDGSISNGALITITGLDFGVKSPAVPLFFDNFEGGSDGSYLHIIDSTNWTNRYDGAEYSSDTAYSGSLSAYNIVQDGDQGTGEGFDSSFVTFSPTTEVYATYMFKHVGTDYTTGVEKQWRLTAYGSAYSGTGRVAFSDSYLFHNPGTGDVYLQTDDDGEPREFVSTEYGSSDWKRLQVHTAYSVPAGAANGYIYATYGEEDKRYEGLVTRSTGETYEFTQLLLGLMQDEDSLGTGDIHQMYIDDVYIDNTQARVELCDSDTWGNGSNCAPQPPVAWSNTGTDVTVNAAGYSDGDTAYLFVIDSSGAVSPAYTVVIGDTTTCYPDLDNDLYPGTGSESVETCSTNYYEASHFTAMTTDCNDNNAAINPGATDICGNGVIEDCVADVPCSSTAIRTGTTSTRAGSTVLR
jgi:hypothetical protein